MPGSLVGDVLSAASVAVPIEFRQLTEHRFADGFPVGGLVGGFVATVAIVIFVVAYVLLATEWVHRTAVVLGGAALMLVLRITDADAAFFSADTGIDWNVLGLLLGMMMIVSVLRQTGVFEYVAIWAAKRARGRPYRLMVLLAVITGIASALLDNVTTVLLIAPITFVVCRRLGLRTAPFLIAEVLASNIGGAATLVGDPPNIIIAGRAHLTFNDFLVHLAPLVAVLMVVYCLACRVLFRSAFTYDPERAAAVMELNEKDAITNPKLLIQSLAVLAVVLAAFVLHPVLHYSPSVVALLGAGLLIAVSRVPTHQATEEVEWPTLVFFAGLFVMVGGLVKTGVIEHVASAATTATEGRFALATMVLLSASAALSGIVDNIPYVAAASPIVADMTATMTTHPAGQTTHPQTLWWALAIGADLGGNATAIGASANVVALGIAAREGEPISFWEFTKYGLVVTALTITLAMPYLWLRYL